MGCTQSITFGCFLSGLSALDTPIGHWLNKDGSPEIYWDGANHGTHVCNCGLNNNCTGSLEGYQCNCDNQIPITQQDAGILTDIDVLPVTAFQYGMMEYESQIATIQVGRFKCSGAKYIDPSVLTESCGNLKTVGETKSGHYILKDQSVVYCDMSMQIDDPQIQTHVGRLSYNDVMFVAVRNTGEYVPRQVPITFDVKQADIGNDFNEDDGFFIVPSDGLYFFIFNGYVQSNGFSEIDVMVNGELVQSFYEHNHEDTDRYEVDTFVFSLDLKSNDKLWLEHYYDSSYYCDSTYHMTFTGYIVN